MYTAGWSEGFGVGNDRVVVRNATPELLAVIRTLPAGQDSGSSQTKICLHVVESRWAEGEGAQLFQLINVEMPWLWSVRGGFGSHRRTEWVEELPCEPNTTLRAALREFVRTREYHRPKNGLDQLKYVREIAVTTTFCSSRGNEILVLRGDAGTGFRDIFLRSEELPERVLPGNP